MNRTTISLPEDLHEKLRRVAADRRVSIATVVREAIEKEVEECWPKPLGVGVFASGRTDISEKASDIRPEPRSWR